MPRHGLTTAETQRLLARALRDQERRRAGHAKARETRNAEGRRRIEKTVPSPFVSEIRRIVAAALTELSAGREPRLRRIQTGQSRAQLPDRASAAEVDLPHPPVAPPSNVRGLGLEARRRAQAARRRARQRAAGLTRTTFDVPAELAAAVSGMVDQLVSWIFEGFEVALDIDEFPSEAPPARPSTPCRAAVAQPLDDCLDVAGGRHDGDHSPLFDDIQAAARLERR